MKKTTFSLLVAILFIMIGCESNDKSSSSNVPKDFTIELNQTSYTSVNMSWTYNKDDSVEGYYIDLKYNDKWHTVAEIDNETSTFLCDSLIVAELYEFGIRTLNDTLRTTKSLLLEAPLPPVNLTATRTDINEIRLDWDNQNSLENYSYIIEVCLDYNGENPSCQLVNTASNWHDYYIHHNLPVSNNTIIHKIFAFYDYYNTDTGEIVTYISDNASVTSVLNNELPTPEPPSISQRFDNVIIRWENKWDNVQTIIEKSANNDDWFQILTTIILLI
jgi:hypothetical protein